MRQRGRRVSILVEAGLFAENKDVARRLREGVLKDALARGGRVVIDFKGVEGATQSFVHALLSEALRTYGEEVLRRIDFHGCSPGIRNIILTVVEYSMVPAA